MTINNFKYFFTKLLLNILNIVKHFKLDSNLDYRFFNIVSRGSLLCFLFPEIFLKYGIVNLQSSYFRSSQFYCQLSVLFVYLKLCIRSCTCKTSSVS